MNLPTLLAQEIPVPEAYKSYVVTAVISLLVASVPYIIQVLKARAELKKEDRNLTTKERDQLVVDLRAERDLLRAEFKVDKAEWKKELELVVGRYTLELVELRKENMDCLKTTAAQEQLIKELTKDVCSLQEWQNKQTHASGDI